MIQINGKQEEAAGLSLAAYLQKAGFKASRIAVELNGEIVPKNQYDSVILKDGDSVEIVSFVGGG